MGRTSGLPAKGDVHTNHSSSLGNLEKKKRNARHILELFVIVFILEFTFV